jgi:hypothetical protein
MILHGAQEAKSWQMLDLLDSMVKTEIIYQD